MHPDEVQVDEADVRRLLRAQFPGWSELPLERIVHSGSDHSVFRLGEALAVRLPRIDWAASQAAQDHEWLPRLAPHLPVPIPTPVALGEPDADYRYAWAVHQWLPGIAPKRSSSELARGLAGFTRALQRIDTAGGWPSYRAAPLSQRDEQVRSNLSELGRLLDPAPVLAAWELACAAPEWSGSAVWIHGDLTEGNVLVDGDRLTAVIDFGPLGLGDPSVDLQPAWALLDDSHREVFRDASGCDEATWARGKGWAIAIALSAWPYYRRTNPAMVTRARRMIGAVLST